MATKQRKRRKSVGTGTHAMSVATAELTTAALTWVKADYTIPLSTILEQRGAQNFVMEVFQVDLVLALPYQSQPIDGTIFAIGAKDLTVGTALTPAQALQDKTNFFIANTGLNAMLSFDLTDDAGNGTLYPGNTFRINGQSEQATYTWVVRIFYRVKNITKDDLIALMNQYFVQTD